MTKNDFQDFQQYLKNDYQPRKKIISEKEKAARAARREACKVRRQPIEAHHTIEAVRFLDWHLENLYDGAFLCIKDTFNHTHRALRHAAISEDSAKLYAQGAELIEKIKASHIDRLKNFN